MKYLHLDVLNFQELLDAGYVESQYYCGLAKYQRFATNLRKTLAKFGIKFPFNPACFKHDLLYAEIFKTNKLNIIARLQKKFLVDLVFLRDMIKILRSKDYCLSTYRVMRNRAILYYLLVTFGTLFYLIYLLFSKK